MNPSCKCILFVKYFLGVSIQDVQAMVENHLKDMILKTFDPKKADTIFSEEGETPAWLTEMIEHPTWRSLIYRLAEEYPDCLMLNFTIKVILVYSTCQIEMDLSIKSCAYDLYHYLFKQLTEYSIVI